ncbi:MAG: hypothetical protein ABSC45_10445 [Desulfobaccales bacterium]|jgi:hypothetical protein
MTSLIFSLGSSGKITEFWDGETYAFDFKCLPEDKIGAPDKQSFVKVYRIIVKITGTLNSIWGFNHNDLVKVLYWYAKDVILKDPLNERQTIMLHSRSVPNKCPFNPEMIKFPNPVPFKIEIKRKIGF